MQPKTIDLKVGAIIWATGWKPYDASKIDNLGIEYKNVITNMMMERLAAINGPTNGKVLRPSDNKEVSKGGFQGRICSMRRFKRRKSFALLFLHMLHGIVEAGHICQRAVS
jgi:heterodisulfide reductase subunit A-like polyferredoxin